MFEDILAELYQLLHIWLCDVGPNTIWTNCQIFFSDQFEAHSPQGFPRSLSICYQCISVRFVWTQEAVMDKTSLAHYKIAAMMVLVLV